jgi:L-malate glycosyltransferase
MVCHLARWLRDRGVGVSVGCLDEVGELGRRLMADGIGVEVYERRPGFDARLPVKIARTLRARGIDVVHAHQYPAFFYGVLAKTLSRTPLIFTEHGRLYPDLPKWRRRIFNACFAPLADRVTAVSRGVRESLVRVEGFRGSRVEIIYNGIDLDRLRRRPDHDPGHARARLGIPEGVPVVGTIGRLDRVKNYGLLLVAFRRLLADLPDARLIVVGDGPDRARLEALAVEAGVTGAVRWLGERGDIEQILPVFDVFTLSSLSEGTPMTLIEAMAASVPIVTTGVGGIVEMLDDGREAVIVSGVPPEVHRPGDEGGYGDRYAASLRRLLLDRPAAQALADAASARARASFSLDHICGRYLDLYQSVSPGGPSRILGAPTAPVLADRC